MKAMVVYESVYGNTEKIAKAIGTSLGSAIGAAVGSVDGPALGSSANVEIARATDVRPGQLAGLGLLIVGSPTQKFRPLAAETGFLKSIPPNGLRGVRVAAFDTRFTQSAIDKVRILAFFVNIFGYAAKPIAAALQKKGGDLALPPEGFYVADTEGPLLEGELERAAAWAKQLVTTFANE
jgi:flavodoxin I